MSQQEEQVLVASVHDVRPLTTVLRGVSFGPNATIVIAEAGLTISVVDARTMIARAYIPVTMFDEFKWISPPEDEEEQEESTSQETPDPNSFQIDLETLLECLNIFGSGSSTISQSDNRKKSKWKGGTHGSDSDDEGGRRRNKKNGIAKGNATIDQYFFTGGGKKTGMRLSYAGPGHPLVLILAEEANGPKTTCEIQTYGSDMDTDIPFDDDRKVIKIILKSSWLRDALEEIDSSCDKLTFMGTPPTETLPGSATTQKGSIKPTFRLQAEGTFGSSQMDYPNDKDVLESYECTEAVRFSYRVSHIACALRALQSSSRTSLRIDDEGLLSLQFMMAVGGPGTFIELKCYPLSEP